MLFSLWKFKNKRSDEKILVTVRRHPIVLLKAFLQIVVILIVSIALFVFLNSWTTLIILIIAIIIAVAIAVINLYMWLNTINIVTDQRIIDVDQTSIFGRSVAEIDLDQIEDAISSVKGVMETVLNFGKVEIQTAGTQDNIIMEVAPAAYKVQQEIMEALNNYRLRMGIIKKDDKKTNPQNIQPVANPNQQINPNQINNQPTNSLEKKDENIN